MPDIDFEDLQNQADLYEKGRMLSTVVRTPVWELIIQILKDYKDGAENQCLDLPPGDTTVPCAHAAASALRDQFIKFQQDVERAVEAAAKPSPELRAYLTGALAAADVGKAMGMNSKPSR
jgi:hypothetical protein